MATYRKRASLARRRRLDDEGDDVSVANELHDDSQSDVSVPSDVDESADADNSDLSDADSAPSLTGSKPKRKVNGARDVKPVSEPASRRAPSPPIARSDTKFTASRDTDLMLNGVAVSDQKAGDDTVDFETGISSADAQAETGAPPPRQESFVERKRREHEEYKKKRDSDPAFIPNRGAFFMHDQRSSAGSNGFRPFVRGGAAMRGRGRGGIGGPYAPVNMIAQPQDATDSPWQHDLHDTLNSSSSQAAPPTMPAPRTTNGATQGSRQHAPPTPKPAQPRNFSTTVHTANALVRVYLPGMKAPIQFQNVPIKQHTRLPNHRPPLRRDKPVRISLPPAAPRYIFPTVERSFIFIPRALRPNQQGFGRGRGGRFGSFGGGYSSRRTSVYGGSVYSPSVAMSRRSSIAREMGRDTLVSPAGSIMSRSGFDPTRPVVRLPPGGPKLPMGPSMISPQNGMPVGNMPLQQPYPLPQKPTYRENWQGSLPMHQPRPQKTVSVAGIESPASMNFNPPQQQESQPFHQQVPANLNGSTASNSEQQPFYPHTRQLSYPSQGTSGTPLSNIPERAIHAPAFQPFQPASYMPQPQAFPGMQPGYYYPAQNGAQPQYVQPVQPVQPVPMFVPGTAAQPGYAMPMAAPQVPAPPANGAQASLVAYEQNGMTYYVDSSQFYNQAPPAGQEGYTAQQGFGVPGMGGMMTPSPEGAYYYGGMPGMAPAGAYYPTQ